MRIGHRRGLYYRNPQGRRAPDYSTDQEGSNVSETDMSYTGEAATPSPTVGQSGIPKLAIVVVTFKRQQLLEKLS